MAAKLGIVEEECDEVLFWTDVLIDSRRATCEQLAELRDMADQVLRMTGASIRTVRRAGSTDAVHEEISDYDARSSATDACPTDSPVPVMRS